MYLKKVCAAPLLSLALAAGAAETAEIWHFDVPVEKAANGISAFSRQATPVQSLVSKDAVVSRHTNKHPRRTLRCRAWGAELPTTQQFRKATDLAALPTETCTLVRARCCMPRAPRSCTTKKARASTSTTPETSWNRLIHLQQGQASGLRARHGAVDHAHCCNQLQYRTRHRHQYGWCVAWIDPRTKRVALQYGVRVSRRLAIQDHRGHIAGRGGRSRSRSTLLTG
ncbi:hypothetical protein CFBP7900_06110 [Xanthomonas hortorum pv. carotae]|uniref:Uncharacterized protein n=1 Tax=Xanthomonas hortorum pv. carotae TaxID=487904 RepID=A0A6V7C4C3_9XANT|nr:hypothetical protein CFBP7900_06110 [Xanthomonas hortorum pv. carotae]CAD0308085.1 hypothetical protein CFBP7900_06110 [Xanthomonas hortorum pv. carotae]